MTVIVDASIAVKWMMPEPGSDAALAIMRRGGMIAPALIVLEVHHALWKRMRRQETTIEAVGAAARVLADAFDRLEDSARLTEAAGAMSIAFDHPIYECLYVALARRESATLATADLRQAELARKARIGVEVL